ncbi:MAG: Flagellar motor switch protein FliM [Hydrogenibacillus schlegelii]|uniref:Flagellar motor switch protein FliM n=1 Tax=Hydrogenibacillus schlegelii TaxID=1484 RepID=A0A2T5GFI9_HYDSH|nr:MAG: Flagellar motor switch protein FliM [Hydrogenibacillus schlegelii]
MTPAGGKGGHPVSDVLSQAEIDALLEALTSGEMNVEALRQEETSARVRAYDFKRALRFSKDHIRTLTRIHENFARLLSTHYSTMLRSYVSLAVASVDQLPYEEFIRSIGASTIVGVYSAAPLKGNFLIEFSPALAYALLERVLGGSGARPFQRYNWTEIEQRIVERLLTRAGQVFRESWQQMIELTPELEDVETNPQFLQIISPNEIVAVVTLSAKIGEMSGMMNICLPHVMLEPLLNRLSARHMLSTVRRELTGEERARLERQIARTPVPVVVELGRATLLLRELLSLEVGDVIRLNRRTEEPLLLYVGSRPKFTVRPGRSRRKLAVLVEGPVKEDDADGG